MFEGAISTESTSSYFPTMEDNIDNETTVRTNPPLERINSTNPANPAELLKVTSIEFESGLLRLIQQLFLYRKQCGLRTAAYHKDCLLVSKTSTVIDVYLDLDKHQNDPKSGSKVFQAEYIDGFWQVAYCQQGVWVLELAQLVKSYQSQCFGTIDDRKYFPLRHR